MDPKNKTKRSRNLPAVCQSIRNLRKKTGQSQEDLARDLELTSMSLSRYETGVTIPRSRTTLNRLVAIAFDAGCLVEEDVFRQAAMALPGGPSRFEPSVMVASYSPLEWRLMQAARIALAYFPDVGRAIEQAAGPALDLVDEILADAALGERKVTAQFYANLETQLNQRAAQKLFKDKFTKEGNLK
jgi:transcriptional regulator with XRE-family HTH domain